MIIVKNLLSTKKTFNGKPNSVNKDNYLYRLAKANRHLDMPNVRINQQVQLELPIPGMKPTISGEKLVVPAGLTRFYVVTYEIDDISKMIKSIHLTLPQQEGMNLIQVTDLTSYIDLSNIIITPEEVVSVQNDKIPSREYSEEQSFGYGVPESKTSKIKPIRKM